eukprot:TCONS_00062155-protein
MKLLQNSTFESLSSALSVQGDNINICGSLESYSCKMTGNDKKLYKELNMYGKSPADLQALSPSESQMEQLHGISPNSLYLPPMHRIPSTDESDISNVSVMNRKMLFTLISTLNASFPDYDFSSVKSEAFSREGDLTWIVNNINSNLSTSMGEDFVKLSPNLWKAIDDEICLSDCEIFSYNPDMESDPFGEAGCLWSFNYFFFNKELKRILFFKCNGSSLLAESSSEFDQFVMDPMDCEMVN